MVGHTDDLGRDTGFKAHAQTDIGTAYEIGKQGRPVNVTEFLPARHMKDPGHLQKLGLRAVKPGDGIDVDHGKYHQKRDKDRQVSGTDPDQRQNDEGSYGYRFDQNHDGFQQIL